MSEAFWVPTDDGKGRVRIDRLFGAQQRVIGAYEITDTPLRERSFVALHGLQLALSKIKVPGFVYRDAVWAVQPRVDADERADAYANATVGDIRRRARHWPGLQPFTADNLVEFEGRLPGAGMLRLSNDMYPVAIVAEVNPGWLPSDGPSELHVERDLTEYSAAHLGALLRVD